MKFDTKAVHAGVEPDPVTGAIMTPIYQTSTYVFEEAGKDKGYVYSRTKHPTRFALENTIAALENAKHGLCYSSGMSAIDTILRILKPGDEIISTNDLYGGAYRNFTKVYDRWGVKSHFIDLSDLNEIEKKINSNTKLIWIETPTNPLLKIFDIAAINALAKKHGLLTVVDNTFATPYLQNPLELGTDIVMHSVTKYLGGHSDVIMGAIVTNNDELHEQFQFIQNACGAVPGPMDCFLVLRGAKTLAIRMRQHCENAKAIADFLNQHPSVAKVYYPGLEDHINHDIAKKQMKDFGGMISFYTKGDTVEEANNIMNKTKIFALAESLGGVESLIEHPASMTHFAIPREERYKSGLTDSMLRLSVGIEDKDDLIMDLKQALEN